MGLCHQIAQLSHKLAKKEHQLEMAEHKIELLHRSVRELDSRLAAITNGASINPHDVDGGGGEK